MMNRRDTRSWYVFDRLNLAYALLMIVVVAIFGRPLADHIDELSFYSGCAVLIWVMVHYVDERRGGIHHFMRLLYPLFLFTLYYRATGGSMFLLFDSFFDSQLTAFEASLFGVHPTLFIDQHWLHPAITEILSLCYFLYYFMIPVFLLTVYWRGDFRILRNAMGAFCAIFFVSYVMFFLYPIEGPRWFFALLYQNAVESPVSRQVVDMVISKGAVHGGCMPSSHFAVALSIQMYCLKYYRRAGWAILPIVMGLAIGTVWGRFHYVSDVLVGGLIGVVFTLIAWRSMSGAHGNKQTSIPKEELIGHHVS